MPLQNLFIYWIVLGLICETWVFNHCGMWDLVLWGWNPGLLQWECGVSAAGLRGKSLVRIFNTLP